jgi:ribose 5-phosphate isomerase A
MRDNENEMKKAAAESAAALVRDGMVVGLGTGSTATFAVSELGRRVAEGLRILGIPTSEATATQARSLGIPLTSLAEKPEIDLTIDGADEVEEGTLNLVKGLGGALLREKIVASASKRLVIVVHGSKLVSRLAASGPVPVEVVPFGWESTSRRLAGLGARPSLRLKADGEAFRTDGGHYIVDCAMNPGVLAESLASELDHVVGVMEHGFFIGLTSEAHVAESGAVRVLRAANKIL